MTDGRDHMLRKAVVLLGACVVVAAFAGYAFSAGNSHDFPALRAQNQIRLMVMTQNDAQNLTNTAFTNLTADTITIPATGNFRVVVRFSAESACSAASWCTARITVDGVEANPKSGGDFAFDSPGGEAWQSLSMDRTSDIIRGTGVARNVTVAVDVAVLGGGSWRLDDWSVVTELSRGAS
jgi:hypothetical protein